MEIIHLKQIMFQPKTGKRYENLYQNGRQGND